MKKILLLLCTLLGTVGAWAQVVTDYASAGSPVTYATYVASAGTGAKYAFMMPSDNGTTLHNWVGFNSTVGNDANLTVDRLFVLENSSTTGKYWLKRNSNGEYLAGDNSFSSTPLDLTLVNRQAGDYASEYSSSDLHISFDNDGGGHFNNGNGSYNFAGGTGGWSTCIAYGPYYIVTVNCYEYGTSTPVQASVQYIVKDGTTINAPQVAGYASNNESVTVNAADATLNCYYNPIVFDPNDVAGKTFTFQCARGYVYWDGSAMKGNASNKTKFAIVSYDSDNDGNDETYLYDVDHNAFVCHTTLGWTSGSGNPALESNSDFSKIVKNLSFGSTEIATYPYYLAETVYNTWLNMDGSPTVYFNTWKNFESGNGGNTYKIEIVDTDFDQTAAVDMLAAYFNPAATLKYVIKDGNNNVVYQTDFAPATVGDVITALPSELQRAFCSYSAINQTIAAGENTINVTVTYNLPFETGTDKLYYAKLRNHYIYYDATNTDVRTNQTSKETTDAYKWSFYGNPYSGIKVKNAATGTYLDNTSNTVQLSAEGYSWTIHRLNETSTFGLYNGSDHINEQNTGNHNLIYWWAFETDGGSQWAVEEVPTNPVDVTYELWVGGVKVDEVVVEEVAPNSAVAVPAALTANYSTLAYDIATSGTIGESDCTITVTATLKSGIVLPAALSNNKKYRLTTSTRGSLSTYTDNGITYLASPVKTALNVSAKEFAILNYENNYYLYSVSDSKFVTYQEAQIAPLATMINGTSDAIAFSQTTNSVYEIRFDNSASKILNSSASYTYGIVINGWGATSNQWDDGCQYIIEEAGDFDATTQLADLEDFFHGTTAFTNAIAQLKAINWGTGLNHYSLSGSYAGYAGNETSIIQSLETAGYSADNLAIAQEFLANYALNMPAAGFYRIKGKTNGKYLAAGLTNNKFSMSDATDASTIFYFGDSKLTNFSSGMSNGMTKDAWAWVVGSNASTVTFGDGGTNGGYSILSTNAYFYDGGTNADRGSSLGADVRYRSWYLEEVTSLPVTITAAGYATLYAPVALTIPSGVQAYYISSVSSTEAKLTEIATTIPAATPVILKASDANYNFEQAADVDAISGNKLSGTLSAVTVADNEAYTLQRNVADTQTGLFPKAAGTIAGFKAYLPASVLSGAGVKGLVFKFVDTTTGVSSVKSEAQDNVIFDLSGRRVSKAVKGIYIVNGKKVVK